MDLLRVVAFMLVFFYHFLVRTAENGIISSEMAGKIYEHPNFHMATLGVSLFFIISGTGLMMSSRQKWNIRRYFGKRFTRIFLPFYIAYMGIFAAMFLMKHGQVFEGEIPKWRILFTLAGVDGYVQEHGISTFSLGVGEWFLGCLIILYLLFPLFRAALIKYPKSFFVMIHIIFVAIVVWGGKYIPIHVNFGAKIYEFVLGMYLAVYAEKIKKWICIAVAPVVCIFLTCPVSLPIKEGFKITVLAAAIVIFVQLLEDQWEKIEKLRTFLKVFTTYAFEMYLVHHWVIIVLTQFAANKIERIWGLLILFVLEMCVTIVGAAVVKCIAQGVCFCYNHVLKI